MDVDSFFLHAEEVVLLHTYHCNQGFPNELPGGRTSWTLAAGPLPLGGGGSSPAELERNKVQIQLCGNVLSQPPSKALKKGRLSIISGSFFWRFL